MSAHTSATEAALFAALGAFADVPGFRVVDEGDLLRTEARGMPYAFLNGVMRIDLSARGASERIGAIDAAYASLGLPVSWWLTPGSRPADLVRLLVAAGKAPADVDEGMAIDLDPWPAPLDEALRAGPRGLTVGPVASATDLSDWVGVMAGSYGWTDPPATAHLERLYDPRSAPRHGRHQLLARLAGEAVACASLFVIGPIAWVTNIGVIPPARGRGIGGVITARCLTLAAERGHGHAWLAASAMGASVYRRLGFVATGPLVAYRTARG